MPSFFDKIRLKWNEGKFVCIGLDSDYSKIPTQYKTGSVTETIFNFNKTIIDLTHDLVCSYKPQSAYYEAYGAQGIQALEETVKYINKSFPDIPVILDAKRADIGSTNEAYAKFAFETLGADAITINPYLGEEAIKPFLDHKDKGIIILVKTSNPGSEELQNLPVNGKPLYLIVAENIAKNWNTNTNCGVVVGATYPEDLKKVRQAIGSIPILIPGIGVQGGNLEAVIENGIDSNSQGIIINSARGIIFAPDPRQATMELHNKIKSLI